MEDDVEECRTEVEEKCEDETSGYTTNTKCTDWPVERLVWVMGALGS